MVVMGVVLTKTNVTGDYGKLIRDVFGIENLCIYFDYPPSTYVLPSIWSIALMFIYAYAIVSIFRVWVAKEEGKLAHYSFILYVVGFSYVVLSFIVFTTCFSVQPSATDLNKMRIHTAPFTNLIVALWVLSVLVTWFGEKVAWKNVGLPSAVFYFNRFMVLVQTVVVVAKVVHHVNCLTVLDGGLWWDPKTAVGVNKMAKAADVLLLITLVAWPALKCAYMSFLRYKTHCVYLSFQDNRVAAIKE